jgi:integrase
VSRSWDRKEGPIAPKSHAGARRVPISKPLRTHLLAHRLAQPIQQQLAFGGSNGKPFTQALSDRARAAWRKHRMEPIGLHECRHTYASFMIAAGVNAKALSSYMGHSSITVTMDRYGHLMPGNEPEAGHMLTAYLQQHTSS